jgi:hypothetical protein
VQDQGPPFSPLLLEELKQLTLHPNKVTLSTVGYGLLINTVAMLAHGGLLEVARSEDHDYTKQVELHFSTSDIPINGRKTD